VAETAGSDACLKVVYTPLHGTGLECVSRVLEGIGVKDLSVVASQACPDGNFPTCPYPNPEVREALLEGLRTAQEEDADILIATDPDADRMGVAVKDDGEYKLLSGNEIGVLLLDFVARRRRECGQDLTGSIAVTTIVSSTMVDALAAEYGFQVKRVLTGFKYIGEQIGILEESGEESRFIFGFEESYGYLSGPHVRDKDAVNASMLFCQMARYHKARGLNLMQAMRELYERHGFYGNRTISLEYPGAAGAQAMARIMASLREEAPASVADMSVRSVVDYSQGINGLPVANVMEFGLGEGNKVIVRPSGTEPKIKVYLFTKASSSDETLGMLDAMEESARTLLA
ncbi:MAG: phospho-sugar mutase, partial [Eggerthellaceae bacterium]|nr:phospho-sugar mutase [Eggerthellaceae bacterium]